MTTPNGIFSFDTLSRFALWKHELTGQLSDGMWENSKPYDHWKFWCGLQPKFAPNSTLEITLPTDWRGRCKKTGYNFSSLYPIVGDRMVKLGRLATAMQSLGIHEFTYDHRYAAEHMPETLEAFNNRPAGNPRFPQVDCAVTDAIAKAYYTTDYTLKHVKADVAAIKMAMKSLAL